MQEGSFIRVIFRKVCYNRDRVTVQAGHRTIAIRALPGKRPGKATGILPLVRDRCRKNKKRIGISWFGYHRKEKDYG